jgi:outer membrane lipoprotein-sorting protein
MRKIISLLLIAVMVLGCLGFVACGGGGDGTALPSGEQEEEEENGTPPPSGEQEEEEENGEPSNGESLGDILGLGAGIDSVKYDMVITAPGMETMTTKMWLKQNKVRAEMSQEGEDVVMLADYDQGIVYMYMPDENMAIRVDLSQMPESAIEEAQAIAGYDYRVIGTETVDGKVCLVVEYDYGGTSTKAWVWKEHGFPIRIEMTSAEGKTVIEYKNIDFGDIPDSMFELPAGVQVWGSDIRAWLSLGCP